MLSIAVATGCAPESESECQRVCVRARDCAMSSQSVEACVESCVHDIETLAAEECRKATRRLLVCVTAPAVTCDQFTGWTTDPLAADAVCRPETDALQSPSICPAASAE